MLREYILHAPHGLDIFSAAAAALAVDSATLCDPAENNLEIPGRNAGALRACVHACSS